jgi:hypothetical protein
LTWFWVAKSVAAATVVMQAAEVFVNLATQWVRLLLERGRG